MNRFELNELIEKAFSMGYEYALEDIKYFSEEEEDKKKKKEKKKDRALSVGKKLKIGGLALNTAAGAKFLYDLHNKRPTEESKNLYNRLKEEAISKGYDFDDDRFGLNNAFCYPGTEVVSTERKMEAALHKNLRKTKLGKKISNYIHDKSKKQEEKLKIYGIKHPKRKAIVLDENFKGKAPTLAHEMGHGYYMNGDGKKSLGGLLHNQYLRSPEIGMIHGALQGIHSGIKSEKQKAKGKKESKWNKYKSVIIPGIHAAALIGSEGAASMHGYKKLKEMGASKELLKDAKKDLITALGSYAGIGAMEVGAGAISRSLGKKIGKKLYKNKKKEEDKNKED